MTPKNKTLFMETTQIPASQTVSEVQSLLGEHGASAILTEYEQGEVVSVSFKFNDVTFSLPCRWEAILKTLEAKRTRTPSKVNLEQQAKRVAWRQILRWIQAQIALVETEMVDMQEVFLPYLQIGEQTLYNKYQENNFKMIEYGGKRDG